MFDFLNSSLQETMMNNIIHKLMIYWRKATFGLYLGFLETTQKLLNYCMDTDLFGDRILKAIGLSIT